MKKDPPLLLWYKGNLNVGKGLAVVGSRNIIPETKEVVDNFVNIVEKNLKPSPSVEDGRLAMKIAIAATNSAKNNKIIKI